MRKLKYFLMFVLSMTVITSCIKDRNDYLLNGEGPNLVSFASSSVNVSNIADGQEYPVELEVHLIGPTSMNVTGDITATIVSVTDSMTRNDSTIVPAVEGVNYRIDNPTITLTKANNYLGKFKFIMLTKGIHAPLATKSPVLYLKVATATGVKNLVGNGKPTIVTLNYACYSNLAGSYKATLQYWRHGSLQLTRNFTDTFTKTGVGVYRTSEVGHWTQAQLGGTPGFTFYDVCGTITIPQQNLVDLYSNLVKGIPGKSHVDEATGNIHMEYKIIVTGSPADDRTYIVDYVKQ
jgi:hypothetical protein